MRLMAPAVEASANLGEAWLLLAPLLIPMSSVEGGEAERTRVPVYKF